MSSWYETMDEWHVNYCPDGPYEGGYSPSDYKPNTYGWRAKYWLDN